jgi:hypothetical protein
VEWRGRGISACAGGWAADLYARGRRWRAESGKRVETDKAVYAMTVSPLNSLLDHGMSGRFVALSTGSQCQRALFVSSEAGSGKRGAATLVDDRQPIEVVDPLCFCFG